MFADDNAPELLFLHPETMGPKPRVLLVEDDPHWQFIISALLKTMGTNAKFFAVDNPRVAMDRVKSEPFDLIISDFKFSDDFGGLDIAEACQLYQAQTPFLMLSGLKKDEISDTLSTRELQSFTYISKSIDLSTLARILAKKLAPKAEPFFPQLPKFHLAALAAGLIAVAFFLATSLRIDAPALVTAKRFERSDFFFPEK